MTSGGISQQIRESGFSDLESDIPTGLTIAEYAASRRRKSGGRLKTRMASIFLPRRLR